MRVDILTREECERIRGTLRGHFRLIWDVGSTTGLRVSDILRLRACDFQKERIYVKEQKTGKLRRVYLRKNVREEVNEYIRANGIKPHSQVFAISRQIVWNSFKRAAKRAGIKKNIGSHSMRKVYSVQHIEKGYDISDLKERLNHSKLVDTIGYLTPNEALGLDEYGRKQNKRAKKGSKSK